MADKRTSKTAETPTYVVMNPRGVPEKVPIISIDDEEGNTHHYYEGDTYDGPRPQEFYEEGVLVTPKQAEEIVRSLEKDAEEVEAEAEAETASVEESEEEGSE
jgi:hypothetical protein